MNRSFVRGPHENCGRVPGGIRCPLTGGPKQLPGTRPTWRTNDRTITGQPMRVLERFRKMCQKASRAPEVFTADDAAESVLHQADGIGASRRRMRGVRHGQSA